MHNKKTMFEFRWNCIKLSMHSLRKWFYKYFSFINVLLLLMFAASYHINRDRLWIRYTYINCYLLRSEVESFCFFLLCFTGMTLQLVFMVWISMLSWSVLDTVLLVAAGASLVSGSSTGSQRRIQWSGSRSNMKVLSLTSPQTFSDKLRTSLASLCIL